MKAISGKWKLKARLTALAVCFCLPVSAALYYAGHLADSYYSPDGTLALSTKLPITAVPVAALGKSSDNPVIFASGTQSPGMTIGQMQLKLFDIFPVKQVDVHPMEQVMLVPCGQPFGVRMLMDGIMVIGFGEIASETGSCCPAVETGILEGDIIKAINQQEIRCTDDFRQAVAASAGQPLELTIQRGDTCIRCCISPAYSVTDQCWQTGLWVRDSTAGIGTLTYYEPESQCFGGLGHPICDADTGEQIPLGSGVADTVTISGAVKGEPGIPGQLQGYFSGQEPVGTLDYNSECGVFGHLNPDVCQNLNHSDNPDNFGLLQEAEAVPMGLKQEITLGEAVILTTVEGCEPQAYRIEITALDYTDDTQNMIIEVTDEALLSRTGGIVQGMSGSPVLQNGKLIGAVTHVFVSQPTMGYAIFAENMYEFTRNAK